MYVTIANVIVFFGVNPLSNIMDLFHCFTKPTQLSAVDRVKHEFPSRSGSVVPEPQSVKEPCTDRKHVYALCATW